MTCGIYKLIFEGTDKIYIGQSLHTKARLTRHIREMRNCTNSIKLNKAYVDYGKPNIEIVTLCEETELDALENFYIKFYNTVDEGFNSAEKAGGGCSLSGEDHPNSLYSNKEIVNLLDYILDNSSKTLLEVSTELNISYSVVSHLVKGDRNTWIFKQYPEKYIKLLEIKKKNSYGEHKGRSKHTNEDIIWVFNILVELPDIPFSEISECTGVLLETINSISKGANYKWLAEKFPEKYKELLSLKGTRDRHILSGQKVCAKARGIIYPNIISPDGTIYSVDNLSQFARDHSLDKSTLHRVLRYKEKQHKGWKLCPVEPVL